MTWFRVDTGLYRHRKTRQLMRQLRIGQAEAVGLVVGLLSYVSDNSEDGDLTAFDWQDVADQIGWRKGDIVEVMVGVGFVDRDTSGHLTWHDYGDWNGKLVERRKKDRDRKAEIRRKSAGRPEAVCTLSNPTEENSTTRHDTSRHKQTASSGGDGIRAAVQVAVAANAGLGANPGLPGFNELLPQQAEQQVADWLAAGISLALITATVQEVASRYKPSPGSPQPSGFGYFDKPVRQAHIRQQGAQQLRAAPSTPLPSRLRNLA